jgi:UDP-glucuronate decarboxylase
MTTTTQTALVTGGAGFLGSHICERLIGEGKRVICFDNMMTGRRDNVAHLLSHADFRLIEADVCDGVPDQHVDEIWSLACPASPPAYQADPVHTMLTSVIGMRNCLEIARRTGARIFQASTSEIYGDPEIHPQVESYRGAVNPIGPRACYDEGKRAAEALCFDYWRKYGVEIKVARIFNTYGPRMCQTDGRVVSNFVVRALKDEPLEIYGDGAQTRSFCYVDDLVEGFFRLMRSGPEVTGPINIGNPGEFTVRELADIIIGMTGSSSVVSSKPLPTDDPRQRRPDIARAQNLLGWQPRVALREGLSRTISYFKRELALVAGSAVVQHRVAHT